MAAFVRQSRPLAVGMPLQRKMLRQLRARSAPKLSYLESQPIFRISGLVEALFEQRLDVFLRCGTLIELRQASHAVFVDGFMSLLCALP